jgi:hypothetical protein
MSTTLPVPGVPEMSSASRAPAAARHRDRTVSSPVMTVAHDGTSAEGAEVSGRKRLWKEEVP